MIFSLRQFTLHLVSQAIESSNNLCLFFLTKQISKVMFKLPSLNIIGFLLSADFFDRDINSENLFYILIHNSPQIKSVISIFVPIR